MRQARRVAVRTSNPERSAATRLKVLEGAVAALNRFGYGAVTTTVLCETAGVTRGGLLHHFPTKAGLMAAVGEHCLARLADDRRTRRRVPVENPDLIMQGLLEPHGVALMELIVASRSDVELKDRFEPVIEDLMRRQENAVAWRAEHWATNDVRRLRAMVYLHMAARRGLAMLALAGAPEEATADALGLLAEYADDFRQGRR